MASVLSFRDTINLPSVPPYYLIVMVQMIMRNPKSDEVLRLIRNDNIMTKLFMNGSELNSQIVLHVARILQEAYGIEFSHIGNFTKSSSLRMSSDLNIYDKNAIALIWNYSPIVSPEGYLDVKSD